MSGRGEAGRRASTPGPLDGKFEYVLCLGDRKEPEGLFAVLREKGQKHPEIKAFVPKEIWKVEETQIFVRIVEVTLGEVAYESKENRGKTYRLPRVTDPGDLAVPGRLLARFIGESTGVPILYDSRTRFADRNVKVEATAEPISPEEAQVFLEKAEMPLEKTTFDSGEAIYKWTFRQPATGSKKRPAGDRVHVFEPDPEAVRGKIYISRGVFSLLDFLQLAANSWDLPVNSNLHVDYLKSYLIEFVSDVSGDGKELAETLLEINGFTVKEVEISGAGRALSVR